MLRLDEEALRCDLAETYHIYDIKTLPPSTVASFACGLRQNSRIVMKMSGSKLTLEQSLLALIYDRVAWLAWSRTKDAQKNRNMPESIYQKLTSNEKKEVLKETVTFGSSEDFVRAREKILKRGGKNV